MSEAVVEGGGEVTPEASPSPSPEATPEATPSHPTPSAGDWISQLGNDDLKGWVQTKGFKDVSSIVESYRNFEKLQGVPKERLLTKPEAMRGEDGSLTDEGRAFLNQLGAPEDASHYEIKLGEDSFVKSEDLANKFHAEGVSVEAARNIVQWFNDQEKASLEAYQADKDVQIEQQHEELKREWGAAFEQNENIANQVAKKLEFSEDDVKAFGAVLGPKKALQLLHKLGKDFGEAQFIEGGGAGNGIATPDQAKLQIKELMKDSDFTRRLGQGDMEAKRKWDTLHQQANPGTMSL